MLILSRKRDEKLKIGDLVTLNIMSINHNGAVSVGVQAPKAVPVHREEIYKKIKANSTEETFFQEAIHGCTQKDVGNGYLILTRNKGQRIHIADDVVITVLGPAKHGGVRIGIDAPKDVDVHRQEIYDKIQAEKSE